jgi:hypothetical protein
MLCFSTPSQRDALTSGCFTPSSDPRSLTGVSVNNGDDLRFTRRTIPWIVSFEIVMEDIAYDHRL